jgi:hypothetical protein
VTLCPGFWSPASSATTKVFSRNRWSYGSRCASLTSELYWLPAMGPLFVPPQRMRAKIILSGVDHSTIENSEVRLCVRCQLPRVGQALPE